ncbi:D-2-hydroxyacid dehydrogenase [Occultella aeris]|uniref:D-3-phosphoglycerate dehydrogenase n=1 Tax=Occultella aeris TaxID=2761496 RepID=A0A7M4DMG0_9MICO|nr:D-2-hydroxyacid dehydrogenase [Occultella aeris]VZO38570.1 D-3-phosphoglycerate dehydrogenase [Occultella aeris]
MTEHIVAFGSLDDQVRSRAEALLAGRGVLEIVSSATDASPDTLARATAIAGTLRPGQLTAAANTRWVHSWAAGANADLSEEMLASDVTLTSSTGNGGIPLAEHSMLLMLMLSRDVPRWQRAQAEHRWDRFTHGELNGRTVAIVGLGNAGADLAAKAKAFHMHVLGVRRRVERPVPGVDELFAPERLHEVLARADFVVVTAPLTADTKGLFDGAAFRAMPAHAYFICISRGGIADDAALLRALQEGWIAGAGLDAHGTEPLPPESPFWDLPNVVVTPHNGATTGATAARGGEIFLANLERFLDGAPLANIVDKAAGY